MQGSREPLLKRPCTFVPPVRLQEEPAIPAAPTVIPPGEEPLAERGDERARISPDAAREEDVLAGGVGVAVDAEGDRRGQRAARTSWAAWNGPAAKWAGSETR